MYPCIFHSPPSLFSTFFPLSYPFRFTHPHPHPPIPPGLDTSLAADQPRTAAERRIVALFAELFGKSKISMDDDFFELGGHSVLAAQVRAHTVI